MRETVGQGQPVPAGFAAFLPERAQRSREHLAAGVQRPGNYFAAGALVAIAYFFAAHLGEALAFPSAPVSALWAPNAILLAVLVLTPPQRWWIFLLAVLPAHLLVQLPYLPGSRVAIQYVVNWGVALIGATALLKLAPEPRNFGRLRTIAVLILFGGIVGPLVTSVAMSGAFALLGLSDTFWLTTLVRTVTNLFAVITLVPLIVLAAGGDETMRRDLPAPRVAEAITLLFALLVVGALVFVWLEPSPYQSPVVLYAPLPLLIWAAVRFGVPGICTAVLLLGAVSTWGVLQGHGPFASQMPVENALSLVVYLVVTCLPLLLLAALIEERRIHSAALTASEAKFRSIFHNNLAPTMLWSADGRITEANDAFLRIADCTRSELESGSLRWTDLLAPADDSVMVAARAEMETTGRITPIEREFVLRDGRRLPVVVGACRFPGERGRGVGYVFDLSEARGADAARLQMLMLHQAVLASLQDHVAVIDRDGKVLEVNEAWRRFADESAVRRCDGVTPGDNYMSACAEPAAHGDRVATELLDLTLAVLKGAQVHRQLEFALPSAQGVRWFEQSVDLLRRREGGAVITRTEVTARRLAEDEAREQRQQLAHLSRAAVLGELSGSFAHELNQPLTSILGNAEAAIRLLEQQPLDLTGVRDCLRDIADDDMRAADVIQRLRALLRTGEMQRQPTSLNDIVREVLNLAHSDLIARHVSSLSDLDPQLPNVPADRIQLQQLVLNLVMNGCEAMFATPAGSRVLTLRTRYLQGSAELEVAVIDQGCGIEPAQLERIFEPFFTTKQQGLGLGLGICRSIVTAHGGRLWAESTGQGGSTFRFTVPLTQPS